MKTKTQLRVFYFGELNQELDKAIEKTLERFGYKRWASGMSKDVRDLAFEKPEEPKK